MGIDELYQQLTPNNQRLIETMLNQLAAQQGITAIVSQEYLQPLDNVPLWVAFMQTEGKSPRTIEMYETDARKLLAKIPNPTALSLQQYFAGRLKQVSASRVGSEQKSMKALFSYLHKHGLYPSHPAGDIKLIKGRAKEVDCPSDEHIMAILTFETRRARDRARFKVMAFLLVNTGLRIEEACSLRRDWVNVQAREVRVIGKGNKERIVPVSDLVAALLHQFMHEIEPSDSKWVFAGNTKTGYWDHSGFRGALEHACDKMGIPRIHPHQLRHYFATRTLEHGAKLEVISKILGHENVGITAQIYRHIQLKEFHAEHDEHDPLKQLPKLLPPGKDNSIEGEFKELPEEGG